MKSFKEMVEDAVRTKLQDRIDRAADEIVASILANGVGEPSDTKAKSGRVVRYRGSGEWIYLPKIVKPYDWSAPGSQKSRVYETVSKLVSAGPARRDVTQRSAIDLTNLKMNAVSSLVSMLIKDGWLRSSVEIPAEFGSLK